MKKALLAIILGLIVIFPGIFFFSKTFFFADNYSLSVPERIFFSDSIKNGNFPFWNHYLLSGTPYFADISHAVFYPLTYLFVFFPTAMALNISIIFHLFISAVGIYLLCRSMDQNKFQSLIGSFTWILSTHLISTINNISSIQSMAWLPFITMYTIQVLKRNQSKDKVLLIIFSMLSILGGHVYPVLYACLSSLLLVILWPINFIEKVKKIYIIPIFLLLITSVVVIPFVRLSSMSTRTQMTVADNLNGSLHPLLLVDWIIPNFYSNLSKGIMWGPKWSGGGVGAVSGYVTIVGLLAIFLFIFFKKKKSNEENFFAVLSVVSILFALGKFFPPVVFMFNNIPIMKILRSPSASLMLWSLCSSILISPSLIFLHQKMKGHFRYVFIFLILFSFCLLMYVSQQFWFVHAWSFVDNLFRNRLTNSSFHTTLIDSVIVHNILYYLTFSLFFATNMIFVLTRKIINWKLVLLFVFFDLLIAVKPSILLAPSNIYDRNSEQATFLKTHLNDNFRYLSVNGYLPWSGLLSYWDNIAIRPPFADSRFTKDEQNSFDELKNRRDNLVPNWGLANKLATTVGYSTFILKNDDVYWSKDSTSSANINEIPSVPFVDERINDQGIKYILVDKLIYSPDQIVNQNSNLVLVYDNKKFSVLENKFVLPIIRYKNITDGTISDVVYTNNGINFKANNKGTVSIKINYYPGWKCEVNGAQCQIQSVNGGMEVVLQDGGGNIKLEYAEKDLIFLLLISLTSLFVFILWSINCIAPNRGIKRVHKK